MATAAMWPPVVLWFLFSALASTYFNTVFLQHFAGDFVSHTLIRFLGSALLGGLTNAFDTTNRLSAQKFTESLWPCLFPAICLVSANLFNSIGLDQGGITLTNVVKSGIPLVTVIICLVVYGQRVSWKVLLTLIPIVTGVALSAVADAQFSWPGFAAAWVSTVAQACLNVSSKSVIASAKLSGRRLQFVLACMGSVMMLAVSGGGLEAWKICTSESTLALPLVLAVALTYHIEYVLNFIVTEAFPQVQFAVMDVMRRLAIILCGAVMFNKELSPLNGLGVLLALCGAAAFSLVKRMEALPVSPTASSKND